MLSTGDVHLPQVRPPLPPCDAQLTARKQSEDKNSSVRFPLSTRRDERRERSLQLSFPLSLFQGVVFSRVGGGWGAVWKPETRKTDQFVPQRRRTGSSVKSLTAARPIDLSSGYSAAALRPNTAQVRSRGRQHQERDAGKP